MVKCYEAETLTDPETGCITGLPPTPVVLAADYAALATELAGCKQQLAIAPTITKMMEGDNKRIAALEAEVAALRSGNPYICSFCAWTAEPPNAYVKGRQHMSVCEKHPMRALEAVMRNLVNEWDGWSAGDEPLGDDRLEVLVEAARQLLPPKSTSETACTTCGQHGRGNGFCSNPYHLDFPAEMPVDPTPAHLIKQGYRAGKAADTASSETPVKHSTEDDFQHFLSYSGLGASYQRLGRDVIDLRVAYYTGAGIDVTEPCSTCGGTGEIDETLGGIHTSNPHAPCPDCTPKSETKGDQSGT